MAGVNVKMGVSGVAQFKQGMKESESAVKTLNAALKLNEAQFQATGDKELYMQNKTQLLTEQIEKQKEVVRQANAALTAMKNNGVDKTSASFQTMQQKAYAAQEKLITMKGELANVGKQAGTTSEELSKIGKGVAWDNVAEGIGKINDKLESAGRAAIRLGKRIAQSAMDSTSWADDLLERSLEYGVDAETLQRMENVSDYIDTSVETIVSAKDKLAKNRENIPELLGMTTDGMSNEDLFWATGEAILNMGDGFDKAEAAQKIFGRSWRELLPLFTAGREEYEALMQAQTVMSNRDVQALGEADDALQNIKNQIELMKNQFWADNADKIIDVLQWVVDNKDLVVGALTAIGGAFGAMKLAEFAANLMKVKDGLGALGLFGGAKAAAGGSAAAAAAGSAAGGGLASSIAGLTTSGAGLTAIGGMLLFPTIKKIAEEGYKVGPDKGLMDLVGGEGTFDIYQKIQQQGLARRKIDNPDWRPSYMQDQSYYGGPGKGSETVQTGAHGRGVSTFDNYSASMDRMASAAAETSANTQRIAQNSVTSADIQTLTGLPAAVAQAVTAGMKTVTIVIGASAVDAIGTRVGGNMANQVLALTK